MYSGASILALLQMFHSSHINRFVTRAALKSFLREEGRKEEMRRDRIYGVIVGKQTSKMLFLRLHKGVITRCNSDT